MFSFPEGLCPVAFHSLASPVPFRILSFAVGVSMPVANLGAHHDEEEVLAS